MSSPPVPVLRGRVWKFGHDVDTDVMAPWGTIARPFDERRSGVLAIRPEFAREVQPGDVVVAGRNWGCGSSREQAPENLQLLGVSVILAESFGRIYFRNAIARAFPNLVCPGIWEATEDGDDVEVDLRTAKVTNHSRGWALAGQPYTAEMLAIVEAGGLLEVLRQRVNDGRILRDGAGEDRAGDARTAHDPAHHGRADDGRAARQ